MNKEYKAGVKRYILLFVIIAASMSGYAQKTLTIFHTNDVHSRIYPVDPNSADKRSADKGGFLRIASFVEEQRKLTPDLLLFDSGDFSQGTPFYNLFKGEVEMKLMNSIGYDAGTIGNHEFDYGIENMARLFKMANHPIVCSNYDVRGTVLEGLVKPYVIIKRNGLKIGILGLGTQLEGMVQADKSQGVVYQNPFVRANEVAAHLKKKGCDVIICLSHLGLYPYTPDGGCDVNLAKQTKNIDIILGGHSHTYMEEPMILKNRDGKDVYISQMGKNGIYVGSMVLTFN